MRNRTSAQAAQINAEYEARRQAAFRKWKEEGAVDYVPAPGACCTDTCSGCVHTSCTGCHDQRRENPLNLPGGR